jgi:hypothetical protein
MADYSCAGVAGRICHAILADNLQYLKADIQLFGGMGYGAD